MEGDDKKNEQGKTTSQEVNPKIVFDRLEQLNIRTTTHEHPPLFTVKIQKLRGDLPGYIVKICFCEQRKPRCGSLSVEDLKIDLKVLGQKLGVVDCLLAAQTGY